MFALLNTFVGPSAYRGKAGTRIDKRKAEYCINFSLQSIRITVEPLEWPLSLNLSLFRIYQQILCQRSINSITYWNSTISGNSRPKGSRLQPCNPFPLLLFLDCKINPSLGYTTITRNYVKLKRTFTLHNPINQRFQGFSGNLKKMLDKFERAVIIVFVFSLLN